MRLENQGLEAARESLIGLLSRYRRRKGHKVSVVFDGVINMSDFGSSYQQEGIHVLFSGQDKADDLIEELVAQEGARALVVSSDNRLIKWAQTHGAGALKSEEFVAKLFVGIQTKRNSQPQRQQTEDLLLQKLHQEDDEPVKKNTKKRGPSRRTPKKERQQKRRLGKL